MTTHGVLIGPIELQGMLDVERPVTILDIRWALGREDGYESYLAGHLPGAVYIDLETELAGPPSQELGRHPLPDLGTLQHDARRWGVRKDVPVVVYDDVSSTSSARAWWVLRWGGVTDVRILDGGLQAWEAAGGALARGPGPVPAPGDIELIGGQMPVLDADEAGALAEGDAKDGLLIDSRTAERYAGISEPIDPRAGHIPGAVNLPSIENVAEDGRFTTPEALRERFIAAGVDVDSHVPGTPGPDHVVAVYCGSGVGAARQVAALEAIGVEAALFPGSWSQWSADPYRDAAVTDEAAASEE